MGDNFNGAYDNNFMGGNYVGKDGDTYNTYLNPEGGNKNGNNPAPDPPPVTLTFSGAGSQTFRVTCTGLKPVTLHKAYLVTKEVSSDCAPISVGSANTTYSLGTPLITDEFGGLIFDYQFKPANSPFSTKTPTGSSSPVAIIPVGNYAFKVSSVDGNSYVIGSIESKPGT